MLENGRKAQVGGGEFNEKFQKTSVEIDVGSLIFF